MDQIQKQKKKTVEKLWKTRTNKNGSIRKKNLRVDEPNFGIKLKTKKNINPESMQFFF